MWIGRFRMFVNVVTQKATEQLGYLGFPFFPNHFLTKVYTKVTKQKPQPCQHHRCPVAPGWVSLRWPQPEPPWLLSPARAHHVVASELLPIGSSCCVESNCEGLWCFCLDGRTERRPSNQSWVVCYHFFSAPKFWHDECLMIRANVPRKNGDFCSCRPCAPTCRSMIWQLKTYLPSLNFLQHA